MSQWSLKFEPASVSDHSCSCLGKGWSKDSGSRHRKGDANICFDIPPCHHKAHLTSQLIWSLPSWKKKTTQSEELRQEMFPNPSWKENSEPDSMKDTISHLQGNYPTVSSVKKSCLGHGDSPWSGTKDDSYDSIHFIYECVTVSLSMRVCVCFFFSGLTKQPHVAIQYMVQSYVAHTQKCNYFGTDSLWLSQIPSRTFPYIYEAEKKKGRLMRKVYRIPALSSIKHVCLLKESKELWATVAQW